MENIPLGHTTQQMTLFTCLEDVFDSYQLMKLSEQQIMFINVKNDHLRIIKPVPSLWRSPDMIFG